MRFTPDTRNMLDQRFGMFVHFGVYSRLAGMWKGQQIPSLGEWIMRRAEIPLAEYTREAYQFNPDLEWAEKLVLAAKDAGMRYIVLTTKHHDGFCLFKSDYSTYNNYHMNGRDLIRELADACHAHDMKLGFYYSHTLDWAERDAGGAFNVAYGGHAADNDNYWDYPDREHKDFARYFYGKCLPQVKELLTNYGDVFLIWFDYAHDITPEQSAELYDLVKTLQPHCMVNSRIAHGFGDYSSLGDNMIPTVPHGLPTECLVTLNNTWGYKCYDHAWKSPAEMIEKLVRCIAGQASLLLNVGPCGDGLLNRESYYILDKMGDWVRTHREAVYDLVETPFKSSAEWGYVARSKDEKALYLYIRDEKADEIALSGIDGEIVRVEKLGGGELGYSFEGGALRVNVESCKGELIPVVKVTFAAKPAYTEKLVQFGDTLVANAYHGEKYKNGEKCELVLESNMYDAMNGHRGLAIARNSTVNAWTSAEESIAWQAELTEAGKYRCELVTATLDVGGSETEITAAELEVCLAGQSAVREVSKENFDEQFSLSLTSYGNLRNVYYAGEFEIEAAGEYKLELRRKKDGANIPLSEIKLRRV